MKLVDSALEGEIEAKLTVGEQCKILEISKSAYYDNVKNEDERQTKKKEYDKIRIERAKIVFDEWMSHVTYGYQKMARHLKKKFGYKWAGQKFVRKLYRELGIKGMKPVFKTTKAGKAPYGKFPYLLRNKFVRFPNQVMATDITYIKTRWGMMYFTAVSVIEMRLYGDFYTRKRQRPPRSALPYAEFLSIAGLVSMSSPRLPPCHCRT